MKKILLIITAMLVIISGQTHSQQHKLLNSILSKYVKNGFVDYKSLKSDKRLNDYLNQIKNTKSDRLNLNEKFAFWINAYNAFTLQVICENYPIESINELHTGGRIIGHILGKTVWDKEFITINDKKFSFNDIEHKILRKMNEPRIHFAIVCASISCPALSNEAFEAERINEQLQAQAIEFINDKSRNSFDTKNRKAYLSKIFDWFDEDFGDSEEEVLIYISQFLSDNIRNDIKNNISKWKISYNEYNWNLNEIK